MIRRIELENYMSHARTVLELAEGLTVICGPNNCGKSAIVSAIETLCFNASGDYMVRHGADQASVTVETGDGHVLVWRRKKNVVSYAIDGREVHRVQRAAPDDLHQHLRLPRVETDRSSSFNVHLGAQKSPIFLIDDESGAAAFFSSSDDSEKLLAVRNRHRQKVLEHRTIERTVSASLATLNTELTALEPLADIEPKVAEVEAEHGRLLDALRQEQLLSLLVRKIEDHAARVERIAAQVNTLAALASPPQLADEAPLVSAITRLSQSQGAAKQLSHRAAAMAGLRNPPALEPADALGGLVQRFDQAEGARSGWSTRSETLAALAPPPPLEDTASLEGLCARLTNVRSTVQAHHARLSAVKELATPPILSDLAPLALLARRIDDATRVHDLAASRARALESLQLPAEPAAEAPLEQLIGRLGDASLARARVVTFTEQVANDLAKNRARIAEWAEEHPVCPVCGAKTEADRLIGGEAHVHA